MAPVTFFLFRIGTTGQNRLIGLAAFLSAVLCSAPAFATFHEMQIEQIVGGVSGNTSAQAIQLRMRIPGQTIVSQARLVARDAMGSNPVVLIAFSQNVANGAPGARILIASSSFANRVNVALQTDFLLSHLIPASYLQAGSLTYEDGFGTVLWRVSFGGTNYIGSNAGSTLVSLAVESESACGAPTVALAAMPRLPVTWKSKHMLLVLFSVTFDCAAQFSFVATAHHDAIDGIPDTHPVDDICPHYPLDGPAPNPDGSIKDKGCDRKLPDGTLGGPVITTVIQK